MNLVKRMLLELPSICKNILLVNSRHKQTSLLLSLTTGLLSLFIVGCANAGKYEDPPKQGLRNCVKATNGNLARIEKEFRVRKLPPSVAESLGNPRIIFVPQKDGGVITYARLDQAKFVCNFRTGPKDGLVFRESIVNFENITFIEGQNPTDCEIIAGYPVCVVY